MPFFYARAAVALSLLMPMTALSLRWGSAAVFYTFLALSVAALVHHGLRRFPGPAPEVPAAIACALVAPIISTLLTAWSVGSLPGSELEKSLRFALALPLLWLLGRTPAAWLRHLQWGLIVGACSGAAVILIGELSGLGREIAKLGANYNAVSVANLTLWFGVASLLTLPWRLTSCPNLERAVKIAAFILAMYGTMISETRSSWMLLPVAMLIILVINARMTISSRFALLAGGVVLLLVAALLLYEVNPRFAGGVQDAHDYFSGADKNTSVGIRLQLWQASIIMFEQNPWFGVGPENFRVALGQLMREGVVTKYVASHFGEPHNDFLGALSRNGSVGLLSMLALYGLPAIWFLRRARNSTDPRVLTAARLGLLLCLGYAVFSVTEMMFRGMRATPIFSTLLVVLVSLARRPEAVEARP
jgi:O-antigen ligase